jgi:hypothetical protein
MPLHLLMTNTITMCKKWADKSNLDITVSNLRIVQLINIMDSGFRKKYLILGLQKQLQLQLCQISGPYDNFKKSY